MRRSRLLLALFALTVGVTSVLGISKASAAGVPYAVGDVFGADSSGLIKHFSPTGVLLDTLNTTSGAAEQTGMCFGESGNLRSTNFSTNNMTLFDNMGNVLTFPWGGPFNQDPESCVLDGAGNVFVGQADGTRDVRKFSPVGALLASYDVATGPRGSDWIDLASDQCTLYYTSEGNTIRRFDTCTNTQLSNFATAFTAAGSSSTCYALRIRLNGEVMVACTDKVYRLSAAGTVIQSYPLPAGETSFLFAMNLDPDNTTFWTAGFNSGNIYRINIATGAMVTQFSAGSPVKGLAIFGEITVARPPASLTLAPKDDTNTVGTQHCVTATVKDDTGQTLQGVTVRFSVTGTAGNSASGSVDTDANGQAQFCYQGPTTPGVDTINAYGDSNKNGVKDAGEPSDVAAKHWVPGPPASLALTPKNGMNPVDSQHCVTASVKDSSGNATPGITVHFSVTGSVTASGSQTTNASGQAQFCYTGPALPGADVISAFADTNNNGTKDAGEPSDTASKTWVLPRSTPGCKVTNGGRITTTNGDKGTFGGNAMADGLSGEEEYQDHGPAQEMNVHSIDITAVVCNAAGTKASIFGTATVDGAGSFDFRIDVADNGEPGRNDTYRIRMSNGYDSGVQTLAKGGNIQIH
jgi:Big-like domain-containing protein